uniref:Peptidase S1 domain-containing protein n=1 Tax=Poecilia mexicana TaxID=48701 RepID=A0A3B3YHR7_9TELE
MWPSRLQITLISPSSFSQIYASPGNWPWSVIFTSFGYLFCQGSLITDQWVPTAAQCKTLEAMVWHFVCDYEQNTGSNQLMTNFVCYENYTFYNENDICLVKLSAPVNFTDYIRPVCLAAENSTFYNGTRSWAISVGNFYSFCFTSAFCTKPLLNSSKRNNP